MGIFDIDEEIDEIINDNYEQLEENDILSNDDSAIELIGKLVGVSKEQRYAQRNIEKLDSLIDDSFLASFGNVKLTDEAQLQVRLKKLSDKLMEQKKHDILKGRATVGIGGKFSAGKSKFINSILRAGAELLPEDQNPTTSIPTFIVHGLEESIKAYTRENEEINLSSQEMQALTHKFYKKYKMGFSYFVDSLIITEPDLPYDKLVFLDTPGYSKADAENQGKTQKDLSDQNRAYEQLKSVDFLIWLVDIENGVLCEPDIAFITKVNIATPILIVANKADKKTDSEIPDILDAIKTSAENAGINVFGVTAYSSRESKEWNSQTIISDFLNMAVEKDIEKDDIFTQIDVLDKQISEELQNQIEDKMRERDILSNIIFKSNSIWEIRTLVNLYGDTMENIRDMKKCRAGYQRTIRKIRNMLSMMGKGE